MREVVVRPPSKINLTLHIKGPRSDGFHELETVMIRTSLCDRMTIRGGGPGGIHLTCDHPGVPTGEENLAVKAATLLFERLGEREPPPVEIHIEKHIPIGGGLGGGSSNAAYALLGLNDALGHPLRLEVLNEVAAMIGSDVPFFLGGGAAICRGRGELVEPFGHPEFPVRAMLVWPGFGVPTAWAYRTYREMPVELRRGATVGAWGWGEMRNDLEPAVFSKYVLLPELKAWLAERSWAGAAMMSGSGATVFGLLGEDADFERLEREFRRHFGTEALFVDVALGVC